MKKIVLSALLALGFSLNAADYAVDASHSSVGFSVKHLMISTVRGNFGVYEGTYSLDPKSGKPSKINASIDVSSINTGIAKRDDHLRSPDFFDAANNPKITFVMTGMKGDKVLGDLTIRGVTKQVALEYDFGGTTTDPWGTAKSAFSLEGKIKRSDFGIKWNQAIEAGGVAVSDEVKMIIEIEGNGAKK